MANGNGLITKAIITGGVSLFTGGLFIMGTGIITNKNDNTTQHIEIRKEAAALKTVVIARDEVLGKEVEAVKDIVTEIRLEQKAFSSDVKYLLGDIKRNL